MHRLDEKVNEYLENFKQNSIEETQAFIHRIRTEVSINKTILWVLALKEKRKFMGTICLWNIEKEKHKAEIGYTICTEFQRKGYMNEAIDKVVDFAFNKMHLIKIEAFTHKENKRSINLLLKNKFILHKINDQAFENNRLSFIRTNEPI